MTVKSCEKLEKSRVALTNPIILNMMIDVTISYETNVFFKKNVNCFFSRSR